MVTWAAKPARVGQSMPGGGSAPRGDEWVISGCATRRAGAVRVVGQAGRDGDEEANGASGDDGAPCDDTAKPLDVTRCARGARCTGWQPSRCPSMRGAAAAMTDVATTNAPSSPLTHASCGCPHGCGAGAPSTISPCPSYSSPPLGSALVSTSAEAATGTSAARRARRRRPARRRLRSRPR